jgi:hypothetical protein
MYEFTRDVSDQYQQNECPVCAGQDFEWGQFQGYYIPGKSIWSPQKRQMLKARRCVRCNNVLQFTDPQATVQRNNMVIIAITVAIMITLVLIAIPFL